MSGADLQSLQALSKEERRERLKEAAKKGQENAGKAAEAVKSILDAKQLERLSQLVLQREGAWAFARPEVTEKLALTQEQKDKLRKIVQESLPEQGSLPDLKNASKEDRRAALAKMREKAEKAKADALAVLSPEQKETWQKMQGKKFDFPQGPGGLLDGARPKAKGAAKKRGQAVDPTTLE